MDKKKLFAGLRALSASAFPKSCKCCGRTFASAEAFLAETHDLPSAASPLKAAREVDGSTLLEVFRNCPCGSTLMDEFQDRRDNSEQGCRRRELFRQLLETLQNDFGFDEQAARTELLGVMHGKPSLRLAEILPRISLFEEVAEEGAAGNESD